jgi:chemotaxis protein methyltransferase CheR
LEAPALPFDLILCRYVAFTYFALPLQKQVLARLAHQLLPGGHLVIGTHEQLPRNGITLMAVADAPQIFMKVGDPIWSKSN